MGFVVFARQNVKLNFMRLKYFEEGNTLIENIGMEIRRNKTVFVKKLNVQGTVLRLPFVYIVIRRVRSLLANGS